MKSGQELTGLFDNGFLRTYERGALIFRKGGEKGEVLFLTDGWVLAVDSQRDGTQTPLELRGPGQLVGEASALADRLRNADVYAACRVAARSVPGGRFLQHVQGHDLVISLLRDAQDRHHAANLWAAGRRHGVDAMLGRLLLDLSRRTGEPRLRGIPRRAIAGLLGVTLPTLRKGFRGLERRGAVIVKKVDIVIADERLLRELAYLD